MEPIKAPLTFLRLSVTLLIVLAACYVSDSQAAVAPAPARSLGPNAAPAPGPQALATGGAACETPLQYISANPTSFGYMLRIIDSINAGEMLDDSGATMTVFLPLDSGIEKQLAAYGGADAILASIPAATLMQVLQYHIIPQRIQPLTSGTYTTLLGSSGTLLVNANNPSNVTITSAADTETTPSVTGTAACSSVVYPISGVLIPPSLAPLFLALG